MMLPWVRRSAYISAVHGHIRVQEELQQERVRNAQLDERARQTADRFAEATARAEKAEDFCRRLTAAMVKLKMAGGNKPDDWKPARVHHAPLDDATIAKRAERANFEDNYVAEAIKNGANAAEAREEAARVWAEVMDGVPGVPG